LQRRRVDPALRRDRLEHAPHVRCRAGVPQLQVDRCAKRALWMLQVEPFGQQNGQRFQALRREAGFEGRSLDCRGQQLQRALLLKAGRAACAAAAAVRARRARDGFESGHLDAW